MGSETSAEVERQGPSFWDGEEMFKVPEQVLEVAGPLSCLWANLLNPDEEPDREQLKLVIQRALVLLGSECFTLNICGKMESCLG